MTQITRIESIYSIVGKCIQQARKARHIRQEDLTERIGLRDAGHLSAIELGKQRVQLHTLEAIARELQIPMARLLEEGEEES